jgi:predicted  nucleic acid-binding Zn-ribbon protein
LAVTDVASVKSRPQPLMSTLIQDLQALLTVQATDSQIDRAKAALAALDTGASTAAAYNTGKAAFDKLKAKALKAQAAQHDAEMHLQSIEAKKANENKKLYSSSVTASRELENLQREVEMLERQKGEAEETVLLAMEEATTSLAAAQTAEADLVALAESYKGIRAAYKTQHTALSTEIATHGEQRTRAAKAVPAPLLARYDAIRARRSGIGAAPLQSDGTCGACHTKLNSNLIDDVRAGQAPQVCEYCGRILVPLTAH